MYALDVKLAEAAGTPLCRFCQNPIPADAIICACRVERGELPHTEWGADVKNLLVTRTIERRMWNGAEQGLWERMLTGLYAGTIQGVSGSRVVLPFSVSPVDAFPFAAGDAALWAAAGYPKLFTI